MKLVISPFWSPTAISRRNCLTECSTLIPLLKFEILPLRVHYGRQRTTGHVGESTLRVDPVNAFSSKFYWLAPAQRCPTARLKTAPALHPCNMNPRLPKWVVKGSLDSTEPHSTSTKSCTNYFILGPMRRKSSIPPFCTIRNYIYTLFQRGGN